MDLNVASKIYATEIDRIEGAKVLQTRVTRYKLSYYSMTYLFPRVCPSELVRILYRVRTGPGKPG